ncbi:hypothetical protein B7463_g7351, partial [Scytalidium lignicola]
MAAQLPVPWHAKFNLPALLKRASQIRNVACSCDLSQRPRSGSLNWVIFLSFEDDVEWVFRSPTTSEYDISLDIAGRMLKSEVATMKYIKLNSPIPVPDIFDYSSTKSNDIGIPYILMSKAPGTQLQEFRWDFFPVGKESTLIKPRPQLTQTQKEKIMRQLGKITSQLLDLRFDKIGSLCQEAGEYHVGDCFSPAFIFHDRHTLWDEMSRGPFEHDNDYYEALILAFLLHVQALRLQHNVFFAPIPIHKDFETPLSRKLATNRWQDFVQVGAKIDSGKNRLDYCTVGQFLKQMILNISGKSFTTLAGLNDGFPLCHPDLSTGNIFVNDDFNIICIIDWAFASTVPVSTCLITPSMPHPRDDTDITLDSAFKAGFTEHCGSGRVITPELWEHARRAWLFSRLVLLDGLQDYGYFKELFLSIHKPQEDINIPTLFKTAQKEDYLVELGKEIADEEEYEPEILKQEYAIARKITMVSGLSQSFVADHRLWKWIEEIMQDLNSVKDDKIALGLICSK